MTGEVAGKLQYSPPEQFSEGLHAVDESGDWYAIGVTFWQLLVGRPPYKSSQRHDQAGLSPDTLVSKGVTSEQALMILSMFHPQKTRRPSPDAIRRVFSMQCV